MQSQLTAAQILLPLVLMQADISFSIFDFLLQVVTKAEFDFTHAPIFQNVTIAAWDPGKFNGTLEDWLTTADYDLFTNYEIYRRRYPKSKAFLIDPHSIWRLWQSLQMFVGNKPIRKNPPSSGFIGKLVT